MGNIINAQFWKISKLSQCLLLCIVVLFTLNVSAFVLREPTIDEKCEQPKAIFHLASSQNRIFNESMVEKISSCAHLVTLNVRLESQKDGYSLQNIRERFREVAPELPVLSYFRVTRWKENTVRADGNVLLEIGKRDAWALETRERKGRKVVFTDFRNKDYVDWLIDKVKTFTIDNGFDGVFIDALQRSPRQLCPSLPLECNRYRRGIDRFLAQLVSETRAENKSSLVIFNGVYSDKRISESDAEKMLEIADGAMIEHFGLVKKNRKNQNYRLPSFEADIRYYQQMILANPEKTFGVFGRENFEVNRSSVENWPAYLYAAYLMVQRDNVFFKYHSSFQIPSKNGLTNGLYVLPESRLDLGEPAAPFRQSGCLQIREFEDYFVVLCDFDSESGSSIDLESKIDESIVCNVSLEPGDVFFLLKSNEESEVHSCVFNEG